MIYTDSAVTKNINEVISRYKVLHGNPPPEDFLEGFTFYTEGKPLDGEALSVRRLQHLGRPRVLEHPAIKNCTIRKTNRVTVDAGCGPGDDSRWLLNKEYGNVTGIDMSKMAQELGYAFYGDRDAKYPIFKVCDVREMPFDDGSVNLLYNGSLIHAMESKAAVQDFILESARVLEPGGVFFGNTLGSEVPGNETIGKFSLPSEEIHGLIKSAFKVKDFDVEHHASAPLFRAYFVAEKE